MPLEQPPPWLRVFPPIPVVNEEFTTCMVEVESRTRDALSIALQVREETRVVARHATLDALIWGPMFLNTVCSQLLLFCAHTQPRATTTSRRFASMAID